jgi:gas vesicle protein
MKNYNEQKNAIFKKKMMGGYIYTTPLNYVKAFLIDYNKKTIRDVVDLLIVKGKWTTNILSQQLSDAFQQLVEITENLLVFDESLADDTPEGTKMKNLAIRADRDKKAARLLRQMLKESNDMAKKIMYDAAQGLIILAKNLKSLLNDYSKQPHELIINWKEIDTHTDNTIKERIINIYKNIYYFIQLLQLYNH